MSLIIETGAGVTGAQSYISVADADAYHAARSNTLWTGTDSVKESYLLKAATYLDGHYRKRWKGHQVSEDAQAMEWPRYDVKPYMSSTVIPQRLKDAQCELALRALSGSLTVDGESNIKREKVDILETEYFSGAVKGQKTYLIVDQLLSDYLKPISSGDLVRG